MNPSPPGSGAAGRTAAFSLVELLVVLGVIAVLVGLLFPGLAAARRASQGTKCLNNLRQIGLAVTQYVNDNGQTLPTGRASNVWDDPSSARGLLDRGLSSAGAAPVVGQQLDSYLRNDQRLWRCPSAKFVPREPAGMMRVAQVVHNGFREGIDPTPVGDASRAPLYGREGQWRPGYFYLSTRGWSWFLIHQPLVWRHFLMEDWMVRQVAGLKTRQLRTDGNESSSQVVLFMDYSSQFHSHKAVHDVYEVPQVVREFNRADPGLVRRERFESNLLYLDGHVETKRYGWQGGLINVLHKPIRQVTGEVDFVLAYSAGYTNQYPD